MKFANQRIDHIFVIQAYIQLSLIKSVPIYNFDIIYLNLFTALKCSYYKVQKENHRMTLTVIVYNWDFF